MISSSDLVAKEDLSAYQRWEVASLAEAAEILTTSERAARANASDEREAAAVQEQMQKNSSAAGYSEGIARAEEARSRLVTLLASIAENAAEHRQQLLDQVLDFSLLLARQMAGAALTARRELVLPVVAEALKQIPQLSQGVQLMLHPADLELVRTFLAAELSPVGCTLLADASIAQGGCRVVADQCEVDATVQTRWCRLLANLGCSGEWLAVD
jgi:flagellar assembly protein FliH